MIGSEGTLAFVAEATFRTVPAHRHVTTSLLVFEDLFTANESLEPLVASGAATVELMDAPPNDPVGVALLEACEQAGIPRATFNDFETVVNGASFFQVNRQADGRRASSSVSYLHPIMESRPNLEIRTNAWAKKVTFDGTPGTLLGTDGGGWSTLERMLDIAAVALAAEQGGARA